MLDSASDFLAAASWADRLAPRLARRLGGSVLLHGPAPLAVLRAAAASAARITLTGSDPAALRLERRALAEHEVAEVDAVAARPDALPFRGDGFAVAFAVTPEAAALAPPARAELVRVAADALARSGGGDLVALATRPRPAPPAAVRCSPPIAVVIPTRNRAALLPRALASIFAQHAAPAEVVVVDDGSTDGTPDVVRGHGPRLRSVRQEAAGQGAAMNAGIAATASDWIAWLDDDDYFLPAKLRLQSRLLADPRVGLAVTAHYIGSPGGDPYEGRAVPEFGEHNLLRLLLRGSVFLGPTAIVRRAAYAELGDQPYDEDLARAADYAMWWKIARRWRVAVLQVPLTVVCRHPGNELDLGRARAIFDSVRRTLRWAWESVPLVELAGERDGDLRDANLAEVQLERAAALLRAGLLDEARADLAAARADSPERAGNLLGLAALEEGKLAEAETEFAAVLRAAPASLDALNGLATAALLAGRRSEAERVLDRALAAAGHDLLTRYNAALAAEPAPAAPGPGLRLARDLLAARGVRGAHFSPAPPLAGIDAYFARLRREGDGSRPPGAPAADRQ